MTQICSYPLSQNFADTILSANGLYTTGDLYPNGIADRIDIVNGVGRLTVYGTDAKTSGGLRSEVRFKTFTQNSGEAWSSVDFMLDPSWTYTGIVSIGSWYPMPDDAAEELIVKHVQIGLRVAETNEILASVPGPLLPANTDVGINAGWTTVTKGEWHNLTIRVNLSTTSTGWREVYIDRMPVVKHYGIPTTYADNSGPHFKVGPRALTADFNYVRMWVRNARQWTGNENFETVMGGLPLVQRRALQR